MVDEVGEMFPHTDQQEVTSHIATLDNSANSAIINPHCQNEFVVFGLSSRSPNVFSFPFSVTPPIRGKDFSQFLLPAPVSSLRQAGQKRGLSKDSVEYRLRRERNNIAVRKSRDKARRRIQLTQQRALQLQDENHRLQLHIQRLSHEVDALRHYLSQRHLQAKGQDGGGQDNC